MTLVIQIVLLRFCSSLLQNLSRQIFYRFKFTNRLQGVDDFKTTNHPQLADDFNNDKSSATCGKIICVYVLSTNMLLSYN